MATNGDKLARKLDLIIRGLQDIADALRDPEIAIPPAAAARIADFRLRGLCLSCGTALDGEVRRGCHHTCYNTLMQRISRGEITRTEAINRGLFNPIPEKPGRKTNRPDPLRKPLPNIKEQAGADTAIVAAEQKHARDKRRDKVPRKR